MGAFVVRSLFSHCSPMSRIIRLGLVAGVFAALSLSPASVRAQSAPAASDSLAFPRQFVKWIMSAQGDSAFAHAAPTLREAMKSAEDVKNMQARLAMRFGAEQGTD